MLVPSLVSIRVGPAKQASRQTEETRSGSERLEASIRYGTDPQSLRRRRGERGVRNESQGECDTKADAQRYIQCYGYRHEFGTLDGTELQQPRYVETLNRSGFSPNDIGLLTGTAEAGKLDAATGKKGFFAKMLTSGVDMCDRDTEYFKQYRRALLDGQTVSGVDAKNDETRDQVRQIVKTHGARFITFFGWFVMEIWRLSAGGPRNPSNAGSPFTSTSFGPHSWPALPTAYPVKARFVPPLSPLHSCSRHQFNQKLSLGSLPFGLSRNAVNIVNCPLQDGPQVCPWVAKGTIREAYEVQRWFHPWSAWRYRSHFR